MPGITVNLTDEEMAIAAHRYVDPQAHYAEMVENDIARYKQDLGKRIVLEALNSKSTEPMPMDRGVVISNMLNEDGYLNAAERAAAVNEAQDRSNEAAPDFSKVIS